MFYQTGRFALMLSLCLLLSGCFDLEQTFIVEESGDATFNFAFTLDAELLELTDESDIDAEGTCNNDDLWQDLPSGLTRTSDIRLEGSELVCEYTIKGPLVDFEELSGDLQREGHNANVISLELLDDRRAKISSVFNFSGDGMNMDDTDSPMARSLKRMIASNFEGHYIRWAVAAPAILESNGDIADDGRSVSWSVPLEDAIVEGGEFRFDVILDYKQSKARFF